MAQNAQFDDFDDYRNGLSKFTPHCPGYFVPVPEYGDKMIELNSGEHR